MSEATMNDMPEMSLDDLEDVAGFDTPPSGKYLCRVSLSSKELKDKPYLIMTFELLETIQLGDQETDKPRVPGQKFDILTGYNNENLKYVKKHLAMLKDAVGCEGTLSAIIDNVKDVPVEATFKYKESVSRTETNADGSPKVYKNYNLVAMTLK